MNKLEKWLHSDEALTARHLEAEDLAEAAWNAAVDAAIKEIQDKWTGTITPVTDIIERVKTEI